MTTNAYLFMWNQFGIEAIVPITQYENQYKLDMWEIIKGNEPGKNPLDDIMSMMLLRARFNPDRNYEIYAIDCDEDITEEYWASLWDNNPQIAADLIREKGVCFHGNSRHRRTVVIR